MSILQLLDDRTFKAGWLEALAKQVADVKNISKKEVLKTVGPSDLLVSTHLHYIVKSLLTSSVSAVEQMVVLFSCFCLS